MELQELVSYIKTQLQNGQSEDTIRPVLTARGWQSSDIDVTFQSINSNSQTSPLQNDVTVNNTKARSHIVILLVIIFAFLILGAGGIYAYFLMTGGKNNINTQTSTVSSPTLPTSSPFSGLNPDPANQAGSGDITLYTSPDQGYGFRYIKSWKLNKQGSLTVLTDPQSPQSKECDAVLEKITACDILVSTIPYQGEAVTAVPGVTITGTPPPQTKAEQVRNLATQISTDQKVTTTAEGVLNGYASVSTTNDGSTYNVLLQGSKNILLIQFPNKKSKTELNLGQLTTLSSITEE